MAWRFNPLTGGLEFFVDHPGGNVFYVTDTQIFRIPETRENLCSAPQIIDGTLIIDGRNTIL